MYSSAGKIEKKMDDKPAESIISAKEELAVVDKVVAPPSSAADGPAK